MLCRNCGASAEVVFADLGSQPLANSYLRPEDLDSPEITYPLRPVICSECRLVQIPPYAEPEAIFREYPFFSGQSGGWVRHCEQFAATMTQREPHARTVLEIASNDGTLLRAFRHRDWKILGIEPARNVAWQAQLSGIPTIDEFFGMNLARRLRFQDGYQPDLIVANNVLAHVPDLDDFLLAVTRMLPEHGIVSFEVPHLAKLIEGDQLGQIYHEHLSYFGFITLQRILYDRGLRAFDVEQIDMHGGSLHIYACRFGSREHDMCASVAQLSRWEQENGYNDLETLVTYASRPGEIKRKALAALVEHAPMVGYGAPAKANTLINYLGLGPETIEYVVDSTPAKQGSFLPGSRIPVLAPDVLMERKPETILVMAPNWEAEIRQKIARDCPWNPVVLREPWRMRVVA